MTLTVVTLRGKRVIIAAVACVAMLAIAFESTAAQNPSTKLNHLRAKAAFHCARAGTLDKRSRIERFKATRSRRRYTQFCTAGRRKDNETLCTRVRRQAALGNSNTTRLARLARRHERECSRYRRQIDRARRR